MQRNAVLRAAQRCILYWEQHSTKCHNPQNWKQLYYVLSCIESSCIESSMSSNTVCHIPQNALHSNPVPVHERKGRTQFMLLCITVAKLLEPDAPQRDSAMPWGAVVNAWITTTSHLPTLLRNARSMRRKDSTRAATWVSNQSSVKQQASKILLHIVSLSYTFLQRLEFQNS